MAANEDDTRALPNLARLSQSMSAAAQEFEKFHNMPAFDANNQISRAIERLTQVVTENTQALTSLRTEVAGIKIEITGIKTEITAIKTQISVTDSNSVARVQNTNIQSNIDPLSSFCNPTTNTRIEGFPQTSEEIRHMPTRTLNTVLEGLGISTDGNVEEKRKRLRYHIGLRPIQGA